MSAKTTYTAKDPNGVEHTRTTARVYTHVVFTRLNLAEMRIAATSKIAEETEGRNHTHYADCVRRDPNTPFRTEELKELYLRAASTDKDEFVRQQIAARLAYVNEMGLGDWGDDWLLLGYCGRKDLAEKLAAKTPGAVIVAL